MKNRRIDDSSRHQRFLILLLLLAVFLWIIYNVLQLKSHCLHEVINPVAVEEKRSGFEIALHEWQRQEPTCHAPSHVDPNDHIVDSYLRNVSFSCTTQKALTVLDQVTGLLSHVSSLSYTCYYSFFSREAEADNYISYEKTMTFTNKGVLMTNEKNLVNTSCIDKKGEKFYLNTHLFVPAFHTKETSSPDKPSVFMFFLESLPQLSFKRFMKRTQRALDELDGVQYLNYFVKPLENSFPNTMAMLTGQKVPWSIEKDLKKDYFDNKFRYLWDEFKDAGYVTAFEEDLSIVGVFNYGKWGFRKSPCDFNPRSFWVQMYPETGDFDINRSMNDKKELCFHRNGPKIELFFEHARQFMMKNERNPYFSFYFYSQMTHNNFNDYKLVDPYIAQFFKIIKSQLNNTILIFAGDHGFRMGTFVPTSMGRIEERMNLVSVRIPESVNSKYPHLRKFLTANEKSLISWYDIHFMLQSVANGDFKRTSNSVGAFPTNPATEFVPRNRTCKDAKIDDIYCVCNDVVNVDTEKSYLSYDVEPAMKAVDQFLQQKWKVKSCLQTVNQTIAFSYHIPGPGEHFTPIERANITVLLFPSNVTFDAAVIRRWDTRKFEFKVDDKDEESLKQLKINIGATCKI